MSANQSEQPTSAVVAGRLYSVNTTAEIEDSGVSVVWDRLARGEYDGVKDGTRTKITGESILRRRASLPRAEFKPPKPRASHRRRQQSPENRNDAA
jgi:nitroimidazol reductase NimA-like FMN-containing flavoprotein (pyridoxamine 5'-phosphate oxidase superfamily)